MKNTLVICAVAGLCATSNAALAFGINDLLIPVFRLGATAVGNAVSNTATSVYESATGKKSREEVQLDKKAFLEDSYGRLEKSCGQIERNRLDPAKAVMTDVYDAVFADEFANTHDRSRKALLTWGDVGDAAMSSPTVVMKTAELQAKTYQVGAGTIGGRTREDTARLLETAQASTKDRRDGITVRPDSVDLARLLVRQQPVSAAPGQASEGLPNYFSASILQETCVRDQLAQYLDTVRTRDEARQAKPRPAPEQQEARQESLWPVGSDMAW